MKRPFRFTLLVLSAFVLPCPCQTLKEALGKYFLVGAAVNNDVVYGIDAKGAAVVTENFNSIVSENNMKGETIHPEEGRYCWTDGDRTVQFAEDHHLVMIGHCLVWHSQPPPWMFTDAAGNSVTRYVLIDRMYHHITTVVRHYRGRVKGWDVVNEAFNDDGTLRETPYLKIIGPDYIELAFRFAHDADPDAELYINDYSMSKPAKRDAVCRLVKALKAKGVRIDAIGMQSHNGRDYPELDQWEHAMDSIAATGCKVLLTELDLNMLPNPDSFGGAEIGQRFGYEKLMDPYKEGLTKEGKALFDSRYLAFFDIISRHRHQIARVTFWGVGDGSSWLNNFPIKGRTNYPLLFDRSYKAKPVVKEIIKMFEE